MRLLSAQGGIEHFKAFARAQGFRVDDESFSPTNPHIEQGGSQGVTASWSIREKGPKFPTTGLLRYLNAVPYIMGIDATWEVDGKTLGYVTLYFDTV